MHEPSGTDQIDTGTAWGKTLGLCPYQETDQGCLNRGSCSTEQERTKTQISSCRSIPEDSQGIAGYERCPCGDRARVLIVKKKSELGLKGNLIGFFKQEVKEPIVEAIQQAMKSNLTQKQACELMGLSARKFRRWSNPKYHEPRKAWNALRLDEKKAIVDASYEDQMLGKPLSHLYCHGHDKGLYSASISTIYRVLKEKGLVHEATTKWKRNAGYVKAHDLLDQGFNLLTYDGTSFKTEAGTIVVALPVLILPCRYLLHVGYTLSGENAKDLQKAIDEGMLELPETYRTMLMSHSDRGSAMKAYGTVTRLKEVHGIPVHFSRPHTPDDSPWIEALNRTMKHHRDAPDQFFQVQDVIDWLGRFRSIYNNEPHSTLKYVTPKEALDGRMEVILQQRSKNLTVARKQRLEAYHASMKNNVPLVGLKK